jgi:hypothetical protein
MTRAPQRQLSWKYYTWSDDAHAPTTNPKVLHTTALACGFIAAFKDGYVVRWKRDHRITSPTKVKPLNISTGREVTFNELGSVEPIASTIVVSLLEVDLLAWRSPIAQRHNRGRVVGHLFVLRITAVPPSLRVLFQANYIARCETNVFERSVVNEVNNIRPKTLESEAFFVWTRILDTKMSFRILKESG